MFAEDLRRLRQCVILPISAMLCTRWVTERGTSFGATFGFSPLRPAIGLLGGHGIPFSRTGLDTGIDAGMLTGMAEKARIDLRLDPKVHADLKQLADQSGLSLNQLLQGIARWASQNGHPGRPTFHESGLFTGTADEDQVIWFGETDEDDEPTPRTDELHANVAFVLDYSDRAAVRSSWDYHPRPDGWEG